MINKEFLTRLRYGVVKAIPDGDRERWQYALDWILGNPLVKDVAPQETENVTAPIEENYEPLDAVTMNDVKSNAIINAITRNNGNRRAAAIELGISERTIHREMKKIKWREK